MGCCMRKILTFFFATKILKMSQFLLKKSLMWEMLVVHLEKNSQSIITYYFWKVLTAAVVV